MRRKLGIIIAGLLIACPSILYADGQYTIGKDRGGVFMQTERHGSWYVDKDHVNQFRIGEHGSYFVGVDALGTYIHVGKGRKFYVDQQAQEQLQKKLADLPPQMTPQLETETKVVVMGDQVLVPVVLGYKGNELQVLLLLDTGASMIVLHREVAERLSLKSKQKSQFTTAGGEAIKADLVKLDSVQAGPITKKDIGAGIIEFKGPSTRHQGLLGMNFLKNVHYRIDLKRQTIHWEN